MPKSSNPWHFQRLRRQRRLSERQRCAPARQRVLHSRGRGCARRLKGLQSSALERAAGRRLSSACGARSNNRRRCATSVTRHDEPTGDILQRPSAAVDPRGAGDRRCQSAIPDWPAATRTATFGTSHLRWQLPRPLRAQKVRLLSLVVGMFSSKRPRGRSMRSKVCRNTQDSRPKVSACGGAAR